MADRFEDLRTFVAVADAGGFSAAADRLGVVKSAVSRRVRELEERLGVRLLHRTTRNLALTEEGVALHVRAIRLLADLEETEAAAARGAAEAAGVLRVTAPVSFTTHCLAPVVVAFLDDHPKLRLEIDTNDRLVDILDDGFDLAIRISRLKDSSLVARRITPIRHVVCASPAYWDRHGRPGAPGDLARHQGLVYAYTDPSSYWRFKDNLTVETPSRLYLGNGDAIREAAIAGAGVAYLPTFIVHAAIRRGELETVLLDQVREPIALYAVRPEGRTPAARVRLFIDFLVERFGEVPFWDEEIFGPVLTP